MMPLACQPLSSARPTQLQRLTRGVSHSQLATKTWRVSKSDAARSIRRLLESAIATAVGLNMSSEISSMLLASV